MLDYFELTDNGIKVIDETFALYNDFNTLWKRDKTSGKTLALKELTYIFYVCDYRSPGLKRGEKGKHLYAGAKVFAKLPITWVSDEIVNSCISTYINERNGIQTMNYISLLKAFGTSNRAIELIDDMIAEKLDQIKESDAEKTGDLVKALTSSIKELLSLGVDIPDKINKLEKVKQQAFAEQKTKNKGRSGINITASMIGDY